MLASVWAFYCASSPDAHAESADTSKSLRHCTHPAYYHPEHFEICCRAILNRTELVLDYTKQHGEGAGIAEIRRVQPLHLNFHEFAWYLIVWDLKQRDYRRFMLTRFNSAEETGRKFERPKNFNAREYLRKNFGIFGGKKKDVELHFSSKVARLIKERDWRQTTKLENLPNGGVSVKLRAATTPDFVAWIAGYLDDCRIVKPVKLRNDVARRQMAAALGNGAVAL